MTVSFYRLNKWNRDCKGKEELSLAFKALLLIRCRFVCENNNIHRPRTITGGFRSAVTVTETLAVTSEICRDG